MLRELLIMARWRVFDALLRKIRAFNVRHSFTWRSVGHIALLAITFLVVLHFLSKHHRR
jgi:hypothetical protein